AHSSALLTLALSACSAQTDQSDQTDNALERIGFHEIEIALISSPDQQFSQSTDCHTVHFELDPGADGSVQVACQKRNEYRKTLAADLRARIPAVLSDDLVMPVLHIKLSDRDFANPLVALRWDEYAGMPSFISRCNDGSAPPTVSDTVIVKNGGFD